MKYLGYVKISLIKEKEEYRKLFDPLTGPELNDLRESIKASGIINNLILEKNGNGYFLLSGHHRKIIAAELGMEEAPCSLAETQRERIESLFDNANRRQLTEQKRKEMINLKAAMTTKLYEDGLIPELFGLLKQKKLSISLADHLISLNSDDQKEILHSLSIEHTVVPKEVVKRHDDEKAKLVEIHHNEVNSIIKKYEVIVDNLKKDLEKDRVRLKTLTEEKKQAERSLLENNKIVGELKEKVQEKLGELEAKKETVTVEVRKEFEAQINVFVKERETRELAIKSKQDEIAGLSDAIKSLRTNIEGLESKSKLWEHECHNIAEQYDKTIKYYSNPSLVEVQLQVISEFINALVRFVKGNKWDEDTYRMSERYRKEIDEQMHLLSKEIRANRKELITGEEARNNVERALGKGKAQLKSVKRAVVGEE